MKSVTEKPIHYLLLSSHKAVVQQKKINPDIKANIGIAFSNVTKAQS